MCTLIESSKPENPAKVKGHKSMAPKQLKAPSETVPWRGKAGEFSSVFQAVIYG